MSFIPIASLDDSQVANYRLIADHDALLERELFVAEGRLVVRRLIDLQQWPIESIPPRPR